MKNYDIEGLNVNKKNFKKLDKIEKMIFANPKLEEKKKENYMLYPSGVCTIATSITSGLLTTGIDNKIHLPLFLLSSGMLLLSIAIGTVIVHNTKIINKLKKERDIKIENHRRIK